MKRSLIFFLFFVCSTLRAHDTPDSPAHKLVEENFGIQFSFFSNPATEKILKTFCSINIPVDLVDLEEELGYENQEPADPISKTLQFLASAQLSLVYSPSYLIEFSLSKSSITSRSSQDQGKNWSTTQQLASCKEDTCFKSLHTHSFPNGKTLCFVEKEDGDKKRTLSLFISSDEGLHWEEEQILWQGNFESVRYLFNADGRVIVYGQQNLQLYLCTSQDEGAHWSKPTPFSHIFHSSSDITICSLDDKDKMLLLDFASGKYWISSDFAATWSKNNKISFLNKGRKNPYKIHKLANGDRVLSYKNRSNSSIELLHIHTDLESIERLDPIKDSWEGQDNHSFLKENGDFFFLQDLDDTPVFTRINLFNRSDVKTVVLSENDEIDPLYFLPLEDGSILTIWYEEGISSYSCTLTSDWSVSIRENEDSEDSYMLCFSVLSSDLEKKSSYKAHFERIDEIGPFSFASNKNGILSLYCLAPFRSFLFISTDFGDSWRLSSLDNFAPNPYIFHNQVVNEDNSIVLFRTALQSPESSSSLLLESHRYFSKDLGQTWEMSRSTLDSIDWAEILNFE